MRKSSRAATLPNMHCSNITIDTYIRHVTRDMRSNSRSGLPLYQVSVFGMNWKNQGMSSRTNDYPRQRMATTPKVFPTYNKKLLTWDSKSHKPLKELNKLEEKLDPVKGRLYESLRLFMYCPITYVDIVGRLFVYLLYFTQFQAYFVLKNIRSIDKATLR